MQELLAILALQPQTDALGDYEGNRGSDNQQHSQRPSERIEGKIEGGGDDVVTATDPEDSVEDNCDHPDAGANWRVTRTLEQVVFALVTRGPRLKERIERESGKAEFRESTTDGINTFQEMVNPAITLSQFGIRRRAPSSQPIYQSGWVPAET